MTDYLILRPGDYQLSLTETRMRCHCGELFGPNLSDPRYDNYSDMGKFYEGCKYACPKCLPENCGGTMGTCGLGFLGE